ncbi:MAG: hypothetical protein BGO78_00710 [Chloroflexi bacterium 44-23]|nr:MAG: hypothetical protein BGO78_00710 [Chloroflexi bacterium 44-23]
MNKILIGEKLNTQTFSMNLESELSQRLRPIQPRSEFIHQLQSNLTNAKRIHVEERNYGLALVSISVGLFFGALSLWFLRRFI